MNKFMLLIMNTYVMNNYEIFVLTFLKWQKSITNLMNPKPHFRFENVLWM